jgi:hypothetical protein
MASPKTAPYSWLSHPLAGMANTTLHLKRADAINRSIGAHGSSPRRWLEVSSPIIPSSAGRDGRLEPGPYRFGGRGQNGE